MRTAERDLRLRPRSYLHSPPVDHRTGRPRSHSMPPDRPAKPSPGPTPKPSSGCRREGDSDPARPWSPGWSQVNAPVAPGAFQGFPDIGLAPLCR